MAALRRLSSPAGFKKDRRLPRGVAGGRAPKPAVTPTVNTFLNGLVRPQAGAAATSQPNGRGQWQEVIAHALVPGGRGPTSTGPPPQPHEPPQPSHSLLSEQQGARLERLARRQEAGKPINEDRLAKLQMLLRGKQWTGGTTKPPPEEATTAANPLQALYDIIFAGGDAGSLFEFAKWGKVLEALGLNPADTIGRQAFETAIAQATDPAQPYQAAYWKWVKDTYGEEGLARALSGLLTTGTISSGDATSNPLYAEFQKWWQQQPGGQPTKPAGVANPVVQDTGFPGPPVITAAAALGEMPQAGVPQAPAVNTLPTTQTLLTPTELQAAPGAQASNPTPQVGAKGMAQGAGAPTGSVTPPAPSMTPTWGWQTYVPQSTGFTPPTMNTSGYMAAAQRLAGQTGLPLTGEAEAGQRMLEDQLAKTLAALGYSWDQIGAIMQVLLARLGTQQGQARQAVNEDYAARGIWGSGAMAQGLGLEEADFARQRQDIAMDAQQQYTDITNQAAEAYQGYSQGLMDLLLQIAQMQAQNPPITVSKGKGKGKGKGK